MSFAVLETKKKKKIKNKDQNSFLSNHVKILIILAIF